jgi:hypothetical protein
MVAGIMGTVFIVSLFRASSRISPRAWIAALERGARSSLPATVACATAGIVVGVVGLTGLGLEFSDMVVSLSGRLEIRDDPGRNDRDGDARGLRRRSAPVESPVSPPRSMAVDPEHRHSQVRALWRLPGFAEDIALVGLRARSYPA